MTGILAALIGGIVVALYAMIGALQGGVGPSARLPILGLLYLIDLLAITLILPFVKGKESCQRPSALQYCGGLIAPRPVPPSEYELRPVAVRDARRLDAGADPNAPRLYRKPRRHKIRATHDARLPRIRAIPKRPCHVWKPLGSPFTRPTFRLRRWGRALPCAYLQRAPGREHRRLQERSRVSCRGPRSNIPNYYYITPEYRRYGKEPKERRSDLAPPFERASSSPSSSSLPTYS